MSDFATKVQGIPCVCRVTHYIPYVPAQGMSGPYEDATPEEASEFEFELHKAKGTGRLKWLEEKATDADVERLQDEYEAYVTSIKHGLDFD